MIKPAEERSIIVNTVEANPNVQVTCSWFVIHASVLSEALKSLSGWLVVRN